VSALAPQAYVAALAGFEGMSVHRLSALLRHHAPSEAWQVVQGEVAARGPVAATLADAGVRAAWRRGAVERAPEAVWQRCLDLDVQVLLVDDPRYPAVLIDDPLPPPVLFARGDVHLLDGRRVAMVGTRNATAAGRQFARSVALELGAAGVHVVSGLARGIDAAAHSGVIAADGSGRPIAVVGSGPDVVYPREHRDLWQAVINCGLLLTEWPPGTPPAPWRFPMRNRVVAALAEVVVVVESRERGGSLITAAEALDRGIPLMAVPGRPDARGAVGANQLIRDGATPVLDAGDVLTALQLEHRPAARPIDLRARPQPAESAAYRLLAEQPRTLEGVALAGGWSLADAALRLARLEAAGWVAQADGWFECVGSALR
jgi:DNA processing protein